MDRFDKNFNDGTRHFTITELAYSGKPCQCNECRAAYHARKTAKPKRATREKIYIGEAVKMAEFNEYRD